MSINDWTAKAARQIMAQEIAQQLIGTEARIAAIIAVHAEPLVTLLRESKREHAHCNDAWYCCRACRAPDHQLAEDEHLGTNSTDFGKGQCTCGADAWNARVDTVLDGRK